MSSSKRWRYHNTSLLIASFIVLYFFAQTETFKILIGEISTHGHLGAFIAGIFFVSTFTIAPAAIVLLNLADTLSAFEIALFGGLGGVLGDFFIFRFFKDAVFEEWKPFFKKHAPHVRAFFRSKLGRLLEPIIGAMIIVSPFPDEIGIALMGLSKIKLHQFLLLILILDILGVFLLVALIKGI